MGISQDQFVEELMVNFRYTVYLKNAPSVPESKTKQRASSALGRLKLSPRFFDSQPGGLYLASDLHIIDRAGYLSRSFANSEQLALQRQSTSIEFAHYGLPGDTRFKHIVMPIIAPCLSQLSYYPTLQALHDANRDFALRERREFDETAARRYLIQIISYLEKLNLVVFERYNLYADEDLMQSASLKPTEGRAQPSSASASKADEVTNIGGLRVTRSRPISAHTSPKEEESANAAQSMTLDGGVSREMVEALKASDRERDLAEQRKARDDVSNEDDIVVSMLKSQAKENEQIISYC